MPSKTTEEFSDDQKKILRCLVGVEWTDSCGLPGVWKKHWDVADLTSSRIYSVGWVVSETKTDLVIASHVSPGQASGELCIPKCAIYRRQELGRYPARKKKRRK